MITFVGACGGASVGTGSMDASAGWPANGSEGERGDAIRLPFDGSILITEAGSATPTLLIDAALDLPACHQEDGLCGTVVDTCCVGFTCGTTSLNPVSHCMKNCAAHSDCVTGCCAPLGTSAITVCLPQQFCPSLFCRTEDQTCQGEYPCCEGLACAVFPATATTPATSACKKICQENKECVTHCCVSLGVDAPRACLDPSYCPSAP